MLMPDRRSSPRQHKAPPRDPPNVLLANATVRDWYDARRLTSELSADVYLRQLRATLARLRLDPDSVSVLGSTAPNDLRRRLIQYASEMKGEGRLDAYIAKTFDGLRSFLRFSGVQFDGFPDLAPIRGATLVNERVPTPDELGQTLERLSLRGRLILLLLSHTGVRPGVLGSYHGSNGLTLADLPDLDPKTLTFREIPFLVRVPATLSKTRVAYQTFGTQQLAGVLLASLRERTERGEHLGPRSPVVAPAITRGAARRSRSGSGGFLTTKGIVKEVRKALHAAAPGGTAPRPYVARAYFSTRLLLSPMNRDLREALMGHGSTSSTYNLSKKWGPELLSEARRSYAAAARFLETGSPTQVDQRREVIESMIKAVEDVAGKSGADAAMTSEDLVAAFRRVLVGSGAGVHRGEGALREYAPEADKAPSRTRSAAQRLVGQADLEPLLRDGWRYVAAVGDRVVVEPPGPA